MWSSTFCPKTQLFRPPLLSPRTIQGLASDTQKNERILLPDRHDWSRNQELYCMTHNQDLLDVLIKLWLNWTTLCLFCLTLYVLVNDKTVDKIIYVVLCISFSKTVLPLWFSSLISLAFHSILLYPWDIDCTPCFFQAVVSPKTGIEKGIIILHFWVAFNFIELQY